MTKGRLMGMKMQKNVRDEGGEEVERGEAEWGQSDRNVDG